MNFKSTVPKLSLLQNMQIRLLVDCPQLIPKLAELWYEEIGSLWVPGASIDAAKERFKTHCNQDQLPLTLVAIDNDQLIGMASLRVTDGIRPELTPWLGGLVVWNTWLGRNR